MAAADAPQVPGVTRREFLFYVWAASIALYTGEFAALMVWYSIPIIGEGEFGGLIEVFPSQIPEVNAEPFNNALGRFWLVNLDTTSAEGQERMYRASDEGAETVGVAAIYKVCTHLGCIYSWDPAASRFACPCHGSKYRLDGRRIASPAPRDLDRFPMTITLTSGEVIETEEVDGVVQPVIVDPAEIDTIFVDTAKAFEGGVSTLLSELVP